MRFTICFVHSICIAKNEQGNDKMFAIVSSVYVRIEFHSMLKLRSINFNTMNAHVYSFQALQSNEKQNFIRNA